MSDRSRLIERAIDQARQLLWIFLYLWVLFGLFVLNERTILKQHQIDFAMHGWAIVNAFILAKVMLVVEDLRLARGLERRPLIYPIIFESLLLAVLFLMFHVIEHIITGMIGGNSWRASVPAIGGGGITGVICVAIILFVCMIPFFAFKHLSRAIGSQKVRDLLLSSPRREG